MSVHLQGSGRARPQWDLEKGAVVNMEMSYTGGQGGKRHKDDDPKPCKQNSLCGTAKQSGSQHMALVPSFRGHPGLPLPVASRALVIMERGTAYEVGAPHFEKLPFLESSYFLFPQIGLPAHITLSEQALEPEARKVSAGKGHVVSLTCGP